MLQRRLNEEYERCAMYLDSATRKPLVAVLEQQLLARHVASILEKGFDALVSLGSPHAFCPACTVALRTTTAWSQRTTLIVVDSRAYPNGSQL